MVYKLDIIFQYANYVCQYYYLKFCMENHTMAVFSDQGKKSNREFLRLDTTFQSCHTNVC